MSKTYQQIKENIQLKVDQELFLKILNQDDVSEQYVMWLNDRAIMALTEQADSKHTMETTIDYVNFCLKNQSIYFFGIYFNNEHIGNIKLGPINEKHATADIAYIIGCSQYWGQGIASKVIHAVLSFGFNELELHKIKAGAYENNVGSIKVLKKNNMSVEGRLIEEICFEGNRIDSIRLGILKTDFI